MTHVLLKCRALRYCCYMNSTRIKTRRQISISFLPWLFLRIWRTPSNEVFWAGWIFFQTDQQQMVSSVVAIFFLIMYHNCERCQNRTIAKMSLAASRTESVGILGRRLWRHLHSLLWSDHACLCREELYVSKHPDRHPHKCTRSTVPDKWHYSIGPSCTANILIRFHVWKRWKHCIFFTL